MHAPCRLMHELILDPNAGQKKAALEMRLQVTASTIWRVLAAMGLSSMSLDDAYPAMCRHLEPALDHATGPAAESELPFQEMCAVSQTLWVCWTSLQFDL